MIGEDGQFEGDFVQTIEFRPGRPADDVRAALALVEAACEPAPHRRIVAALAELALATKARADYGDDTAARIGLLARELGEFPADVAIEACRRRARGYQFFPSLMELRMTCQILGGKRMALRAGLRQALEMADAQA